MSEEKLGGLVTIAANISSRIRMQNCTLELRILALNRLA